MAHAMSRTSATALALPLGEEPNQCLGTGGQGEICTTAASCPGPYASACVADDPGQHSSQNEQDTRQFARMAKIPIFEPSDSQEAKEMVRVALEVSEKFRTPVILRSTTRVSHSRSQVELGERRAWEPVLPFGGDHSVVVDDHARVGVELRHVLGAHILSDNATGLINTFRMAMLGGIDIRKLRQESITSPYPSRESDLLYMLDPLVQ